MKSKEISFASLLGSIICMVVLAGCSQSTAPTADLRLGAVVVLSGDNALWGENARKSMDLIVKDVNAAGGVNGRQVSVIYEDSKGDPKTALSAFRKLKDLSNVPIVLGDMLTSTTLAMAPAANESHVVLIGISCSAPSVTSAGPFVYRVWPSDLYEGRVFAEYVFSKGTRSVALVHLNNDYGNGLKDAFKSRFQELGGHILGEDAYTDADRDFRSIAVRVNSNNPEAVYIVGYYEDTARVIKGFREAGVAAKLFGTSSSIHQKLLEIAGAGAEGFVAALVNDYDTQALTPTQKEYAQKYKSQYGSDPDWAATHAADALLVAVDCFRNGNTTGDSVKQFIDTKRTFQGINRGITFDENGDVVGKPIAVQEVRGAKFVTIWQESDEVKK